MKDTTFKDAYKLAYMPKEEFMDMMLDSEDKDLREFLRLLFEGLALAVVHIPGKWLRLDLHRTAQFFRTITSHLEGVDES